MNENTPRPGTFEDKAARYPGFTLTGAAEQALPDGAAAAHALIDIAEDLARYLRVVSGGALTIGILDNHATTAKERQGIAWGDAHEVLSGRDLASTRRDVLATRAIILRGLGAEGEHMTAHLDEVAPEHPACGRCGVRRDEHDGQDHEWQWLIPKPTS